MDKLEREGKANNCIDSEDEVVAYSRYSKCQTHTLNDSYYDSEPPKDVPRISAYRVCGNTKTTIESYIDWTQ